MHADEKRIHEMPSETEEQRQAQVDALIALADDPDHEYDGHHGRDRTAEEFFEQGGPRG